MTNSLIIAAFPGHAGDVTIFLSTIALSASISIYLPPARSISGATAGYDVRFKFFTTPAAVKIWGPWHIAAIGFLAWKNSCTSCNTLLFSLRYSGERPPVINSPI